MANSLQAIYEFYKLDLRVLTTLPIVCCGKKSTTKPVVCL